MAKILTLFEWALGYIAVGLSFLSLLFTMFTDSPHFHEKLGPLQKDAFQFQGVILIAVPSVVIGSFVLQFFLKDYPWSHIVAVVSGVSFIYFWIFFSAYFSLKNPSISPERRLLSSTTAGR